MDMFWKIMEATLGYTDTVDAWKRRSLIEYLRHPLEQPLLLRVRAAPHKEYMDPDSMHHLIERKNYLVKDDQGRYINMDRYTRLLFQLGQPRFPVIEDRDCVLAVRDTSSMDYHHDSLNASANNPDCLRAFVDYLGAQSIPYLWQPTKTAFWHQLRDNQL
jgi:hypothetical protein